MRSSLYLALSKHSLEFHQLKKKKVVEQQQNYAILILGLPSFDAFHFPRAAGSLVLDQEHLSFGHGHGFLFQRAVFVPPDSAAFWLKNEVPNLTPFISRLSCLSTQGSNNHLQSERTSPSAGCFASWVPKH